MKTICLAWTMNEFKVNFKPKFKTHSTPSTLSPLYEQQEDNYRPTPGQRHTHTHTQHPHTHQFTHNPHTHTHTPTHKQTHTHTHTHTHTQQTHMSSCNNSRSAQECHSHSRAFQPALAFSPSGHLLSALIMLPSVRLCSTYAPHITINHLYDLWFPGRLLVFRSHARSNLFKCCNDIINTTTLGSLYYL